jgi:hypothetical protein
VPHAPPTSFSLISSAEWSGKAYKLSSPLCVATFFVFPLLYASYVQIYSSAARYTYLFFENTQYNDAHPNIYSYRSPCRHLPDVVHLHNSQHSHSIH